LFQSIEEYRELTFIIGSPIVFQTAPPHPASNARIICSPQLVGGAEASQKGLMQGIPAKVVLSVGTLSLQPRSDADSGTFAVGHCIHYFASTIGAVASCKILRVRRLPGDAIDKNVSALKLDLAVLKKISVRRLSDG
jgi:hypothetical protein